MIDKVSDLHNFWKWWSVQLGLLSASLSAAATAYGAIYVLAPDLVSGLPRWVGVGITGGAMFSAAASVWVRRWVQPKLKEESKDVVDSPV
jgi:hypothetical protein